LKINLLSHDNGVGLTQDVKIVKAILSDYDCKFIDIRYKKPSPADVNLFFEVLSPKFFPSAKHNLLFPNPEWFMWPTLMKQIDLVLCKTHDAERMFKAMNCKTVYTSFTSEDRKANMEFGRVYLHTAGQSLTKGTATIYKSWKPEYPEMILTSLKDGKKYTKAQDNIYTMFDRMPIEILIELQNKCAFHLCPSEYEGFGHYIWEGKSCGAIIITTDAEPMREMVTDGVDGFLVRAGRIRKQNFGRLHMISQIDFQSVIERCMKLTDPEIIKMRHASRNRWELNDKYFKDKLIKIIKDYE
jgi:hypothetical protein